jgi:hypothetical protein
VLSVQLSSSLKTDFKKSSPRRKYVIGCPLIQLIIFQSVDSLPFASKNSRASRRSPLFCNSKCKCVPVDRPLLSTSPMTCSAEISSPSFTEFLVDDDTEFDNRRRAPECFAPNLQHKPRSLKCGVPFAISALRHYSWLWSRSHSKTGATRSSSERRRIRFTFHPYPTHRGANHSHRASKSSSPLSLLPARKTGNPAKWTFASRKLWQAIRNTSLASQFSNLVALENFQPRCKSAEKHF